MGWGRAIVHVVATTILGCGSASEPRETTPDPPADEPSEPVRAAREVPLPEVDPASPLRSEPYLVCRDEFGADYGPSQEFGACAARALGCDPLSAAVLARLAQARDFSRESLLAAAEAGGIDPATVAVRAPLRLVRGPAVGAEWIERDGAIFGEQVMSYGGSTVDDYPTTLFGRDGEGRVRPLIVAEAPAVGQESFPICGCDAEESPPYTASPMRYWDEAPPRVIPIGARMPMLTVRAQLVYPLRPGEQLGPPIPIATRFLDVRIYGIDPTGARCPPLEPPP